MPEGEAGHGNRHNSAAHFEITGTQTATGDFNMENSVLSSHGLQTQPASTIQPMMMDALSFNIAQLLQQIVTSAVPTPVTAELQEEAT